MILCSDRGTEPLFKMVISNPAKSRIKPSKTIETLERCLDLSQYERIIILDDDGPNSWNRHEMMEQSHFMLIKVPELSVWRSVQRQFSIFAAKRDLPRSEAGIAEFFYSMATAFRNRDQFFVQFHEFLQSLYQNDTRISCKYIARMTPVSRNGVTKWRAWPSK